MSEPAAPLLTVELSVIVPALDEARHIRAQLVAVLAQDCPAPFEVVVADGGSADRTREIVEATAAGDPRLRPVDVPGSRSSAQAINAAVAVSRGRGLVYTHADDVLAPGCLAALHDALRRHPMAAARLDHHAQLRLDGAVPRHRPDGGGASLARRPAVAVRVRQRPGRAAGGARGRRRMG